MKTTILLAACLLIVSIGCKKSGVDSQTFPDGNYAGTFRFGQPWGGPFPVFSHVTLRLHHGQFEGESDNMYFPKICRGTFTRTDNIVSFKNDCKLPDNTSGILLEGGWDISSEGDSIRVTLPHFNSETDILTLKRLN